MADAHAQRAQEQAVARAESFFGNRNSGSQYNPLGGGAGAGF